MGVRVVAYCGTSVELSQRMISYWGKGSHISKSDPTIERRFKNSKRNIKRLQPPNPTTDPDGDYIYTRVARFSSPQNAYQAEEVLLGTFDYPWNKKDQGTRKKVRENLIPRRVKAAVESLAVLTPEKIEKARREGTSRSTRSLPKVCLQKQ